MTRKIRLITLLIFSIIFLIFAPYLTLYSLGYRVDLKNFKIVASGGIYIKATPSGADITIDKKIKDKTGILSGSFFAQNLLPGKHNIMAGKDGYYEYRKEIEIKEKEVTKLENIVLFKQNIAFALIENYAEKFYHSPNGKYLLVQKTDGEKSNFTIIETANLNKFIFSLATAEKIDDIVWSDNSEKTLLKLGNDYFLTVISGNETKTTPLPSLSAAESASFNPQNSDEIFFKKNKDLYSNRQGAPIIRNIKAYSAENGVIFWLSPEGFLYKFGSRNNKNDKINTQPITIISNGNYEVIRIAGKTFIKENSELLIFNEGENIFKSFYNPVKNIALSPDNRKILFCNNREALFSDVSSANPEKTFLNRFSDEITDCQWLNDNYIIINFGNKVAISEIDTRGNINMVYFSQNLPINNQSTINLNNAETFFNRTDNKLYILTENTLIVSEKLIP